LQSSRELARLAAEWGVGPMRGGRREGGKEGAKEGGREGGGHRQGSD